MEENKNIEESGVSLGDIFHWIWRGKIPGLITAAVLGIILFIMLALVIGPQSEIYEVEFDYSSVPGLDNGSYIDGSRFTYQDIILEESVNEVVAENKEALAADENSVDFSTIDLDELYSSNLFRVDRKRIYWENVADTTTEPELKATHYIIEMPKSAFKSGIQARAFAKALIELPLAKTKKMIQTLDFTTNLDMYEVVQSFDTKLEYLSNQISLLQNGYSSFNGVVNGTQYVIDGKTYNFAAINARISDFLTTQNYSTMGTELRQKGYVNDKTLAKQRYELQMDDLVKEHELLEKKLASVNTTYEEAKTALNNIGSGSIVATDQILSLLTQLNDTLLNQKTSLEFDIIANEEEQRKLNIKIDALNNLSDEDNAAFAERLDNIYTRLVEETITYDKVYKEITTRNMYVYYVNSNVIAVTGGMSSIMTLGVTVVVALVGFVGVAWIYGYVKCKKEEKALLEENKQN